MTIKKDDNCSVALANGVEYISLNDLTNPMKVNGKPYNDARIELCVCVADVDIKVNQSNKVTDTNRFEGVAIIGARPKNIVKR
jgi:hypothetical protein